MPLSELMFNRSVMFNKRGQTYYEQKKYNECYKDKSIVHFSSSSRKNQIPTVKHNEVIINPAIIVKGFILPTNVGKKYPNTIAANTSFPISIQIVDKALRWDLLNPFIVQQIYHSMINLSRRFSEDSQKIL